MTATFYVGDAIKVMGQLPEKSVDLVLTSPLDRVGPFILTKGAA
jgi:DNA modification methylase